MIAIPKHAIPVGLILAATLTLSSTVWAQVGGYIGFAAGQADDKVFNETDRGLKVFGGWQFAPNLAAEFAYVDLGSYGPTGATLDQYGVTAQFVGFIPLGQSGVSLFGKAGVMSWKVEQYDSNYYYSATAEDSGTDLAVGAGVQIDFHRHMGLRAEWERFYDVAGGDVDLISAGFFYRF